MLWWDEYQRPVMLLWTLRDISARYNTPRFSSHDQKHLASALSWIIMGNRVPAYS